ncbi:MAG TPA: 4-hydroxythreonine-4-phosphate dehydrogenase PdxA [Pseudonocardiaceae bacterium]|nr:4-hydroxythreonine-4-phosphate dehydrogenase PdxA [Pseudonocardiaceae bacterium]
MKPRVCLTLGDPSGVGSELVAKLLSLPDITEQADIVVVGSAAEFERGQEIAGVTVTAPIQFQDVPIDGVHEVGAAGAVSGRHTLAVLGRAMDMAAAGAVDAVCFAPLNKESLHAGGNSFEDELHWFADRLGVDGFICEINALDEVWTSRVSSHIPMRDAYGHITEERILAAVRLLDEAMRSAGRDTPRFAVCGFNPHAGDGGLLGREEIEVIAPAVAKAREFIDTIDGPFSADTVFLKVRAGQYDGVVTMFHDQGQIALKLMGFERGVTIQGGLPFPVTTPAHGTAFDIVGKNLGNVSAFRHAFDMACTMVRHGAQPAQPAANRTTGVVTVPAPAVSDDGADRAEAWPIAAAMLPYPAVLPDGSLVQDQPAEHWHRTLAEVCDLEFRQVDITDSWLRAGDLTADRRDELISVLADLGLGVPAISTARRSVIDPRHGADNLAYCHRVLDAAAAMGADLVSVGLFQALTEEQRSALWFWTVPGASDPDDPEVWKLAVARLRELGAHAAELGLALSLEMYEDTYLGTADSAVRLVTDIDLPNVGLNPDLGNLVRLQRPVEAWQSMLDKTLPYANYWHVKNYFRSEDPATGAVFSTPAPLELGVINYRAAIAQAVRSGYRGAFCAEHYGGDGLGVAARNRDYLRALLRQAHAVNAKAVHEKAGNGKGATR